MSPNPNPNPNLKPNPNPNPNNNPNSNPNSNTNNDPKRLCADSAGCAAGVYNAWSKVPEEGKLQILCLLLALETANESKKPHYMRGGVPGRIDQLPFDGITGLWAPKIKFWDPLGFTNALTDAEKARKRKAELKNGRLAMIGIISFLVGHNLPGAVPALNSQF